MTAIARTTTVSTKGQVILPKALRDQLKWDVETRLIVEHTAGGDTAFAPTRPQEMFGCLHTNTGPKSIEDMGAKIGVEVQRRHARGRS